MITSVFHLAETPRTSYLAAQPKAQHVFRKSFNISFNRNTNLVDLNRIWHTSFLKRVTIWACVILFFIAWVFMMSGKITYAKKIQSEPAASVRYIVQPGDTLWKIAMEGKQTNNLYNKIQRIESVNQLNDNSNIYPGEVLWIPVS